jgi:hypothetical protein
MLTAKDIKELKKKIPDGVSYQDIANQAGEPITKDIVANLFNDRLKDINHIQKIVNALKAIIKNMEKTKKNLMDI